MQGYNYGPYGNFGNANNIGGVNANGIRNNINNGFVGANNPNGVGFNAAGYSGGGYQMNGFNAMPPQADNRTFVTGRAGAEAYPLPQGVNTIFLWDTEAKRFYIKGYDNNGMPRILEDNDYGPHVEIENTTQGIDMSKFVTKEDLDQTIQDVAKEVAKEVTKKVKTPNLTGYATIDDLNKALSELCVGSGGRVVRNNESDE